MAVFLDTALRRGGGMPLADLRDRIAKGALLWVAADDAIRGAAVTELWNAHSGKVCVVTAMGGKGAELRGGIEAWARSEGCVAMRLYGRKGWARALPDYADRWRIYEKAL